MTGFTTKQYTDRRRPPWLWPVVALAAVIVVAVVVGFSLSDGGGPLLPSKAPRPQPRPCPHRPRHPRPGREGVQTVEVPASPTIRTT